MKILFYKFETQFLKFYTETDFFLLYIAKVYL